MGLFRKNKDKKQRKHIDLSKPLEVIECVGLIIGIIGLLGNIPLYILVYRLVCILVEPGGAIFIALIGVAILNAAYSIWTESDSIVGFDELIEAYIPFGFVTIVAGSIYATIKVFLTVLSVFR